MLFVFTPRGDGCLCWLQEEPEEADDVCVCSDVVCVCSDVVCVCSRRSRRRQMMFVFVQMLFVFVQMLFVFAPGRARGGR